MSSYSINISQLKERITLLSLQSSADLEGKEQWKAHEEGQAWAQIARLPSSHTERNSPFWNSNKPLYKVTIRARPALADKIGLSEQRSEINALHCRYGTLKIIDGFSPHPNAPHFWTAFCTKEKAERMAEPYKELEKESETPSERTCQSNSNKDTIEYKERFSTTRKSKQRLNKEIKNKAAAGRTQQNEKAMQDSQGQVQRENDHAKN